MTKTGPRDDTKLAAIKLEWWPRSDWNRWPPSLESAMKWRVMVELGGAEGTVEVLNSVQNFPDSGGKQRPIVSTLVRAIIRRFRWRIWGVVHGYDCRNPAPSFG